MRYLRELLTHLITALVVFVLFFLLFEKRVVVPEVLRPIGRLHPLFLHFPIVLIILATLLQTFKTKIPIEPDSHRWLVNSLLITTVFTAGTTVVFGLLLSKEDGYTGDTVFWHKWTGVLVFLGSYFIWALRKKLQDHLITTAFWTVSGTLTIAGHLGASLTHGENYLTESFKGRSKATPDFANPDVYADLVVPVLKEKCYSCHNPDKAKGELILTDTLSFYKGGVNGSPIKWGDAEASLLLKLLLSDPEEKRHMPPKGKPQPTRAELSLLRSWINEGRSFRDRLEKLSNRSEIRKLGEEIYGGKSDVSYHFGPADPKLIASLNSIYRVITPVALESPALDVRFFGQSVFTPKLLEELKPLATQIISIDLSGLPFTDNDLPLLQPFTNLEKLNLNQTSISQFPQDLAQKLTNLRILQISGTGISANSLKAFETFPKLRKLYAWNTKLTADDATSLNRLRSGIRMETGTSEQDNYILQLNKPAIMPENTFFREPFYLQLTHPINGTSIYYSLDGTVPDSLNSPLYKDPILVDKDLTVRAKAVKTGWLSADIIEKSYQRTTLLPDSIRLITFPHPHHKGQGSKTLFDLEGGSTDILYASDGKWLGYHEHPFKVELSFNHPSKITEIIFSTLTSVNLQAFPPSEIVISQILADGTEKTLSKTSPAVPEKGHPISRNMIRCTLPGGTTAERLQISIKPLQKLPSWHTQAGNPAWFFIDEILIN